MHTIKSRVLHAIGCMAVCLLIHCVPALAQTEPQPPAAAQPTPAPTADTAASQPERRLVSHLVFSNANLNLVLNNVQNQTGDKIIVRGNLGETKITIGPLSNVTTEQVLDGLANSYGWVWVQREDKTYELMDKATYQATVLPQFRIRKVFRPQYRPPDEVVQLLEPLKTPELGSVTVDPKTGKIIVVDLPERINAMQQLIQEIDIPLVWRVFDIKYADLETVQSQLEDLLTPSVGTMKVDQRTHQIIVHDLYKATKQMELLVMALDKAPEVRAYDVNRIGIDGETFQEIVDKVSALATQPENVTSDFEMGRILVEDIPEVQDRIARLLRVFDQPARQIMLMAEIIEADLDRTLSFTSQIELSADLEKAIGSGLTNLYAPATGNGGSQSASFNFANLEDALPVARLGSGGITVSNLSKHYAAQLSALLSDSDTKVLLKPRIIVLNQQEATIFVGRDEPIPTVFINDNVNNSLQQSTQTTVNTGLTLDIIPSIASTGLVQLEVSLENSEPFRVSVQTTNGAADLLGKTSQRIETQLMIPSGETRVLGGLNRKQNSQTKAGVPILRNIPLIGPAFGSYGSTSQDRTLLFFLTPIIMEEQPSEQFLRKSQSTYSDVAASRPAMTQERTVATAAGSAEEDNAGKHLVFEHETGPLAEQAEEEPEVTLSSESPTALNETTETNTIKSTTKMPVIAPSGTVSIQPTDTAGTVVRTTTGSGGAVNVNVPPTPVPAITPQPTPAAPIVTPVPAATPVITPAATPEATPPPGPDELRNR